MANPFVGVKIFRENQRYVRMEAKFDSHCEECEEDILEGDQMVYDTLERKAYCAECGESLI